MATAGDRLNRQQLRLLIGVCVAVGVAYLQPATYNYVITPMLTTFGAGQTDAALLREAPSIASLLVIFPAAVLADRLGRRRLSGVGAVLLIAGSAVTAGAPALWAAAAGLGIQAIGGTILIVVPLGVIGAAVTGAGARATAFSAFSMMSPLVFVFMPVATAVFMENRSWRVVAATWAVGGVVALIAVRWSLGPDTSDRASGELLTPVLASAICMAAAQWATHVTSDGITSAAAMTRAGIVVAAGLALGIALRHVQRPSLDVVFLRSPGVPLMLVAITLWCFTQLWYYMTLAYEFVYGHSVLQTALLMAPAQACAAVGARSAGWMTRRFGLFRSGFWLLILTGLSLAISAFVTAGWPTWALVSVTCMYSFFALAAGVPMTTSIMDAASSGGDSSSSAARQAAIGVGTAVGIALFSAIALLAFTNSFAARAAAEGLDAATAKDMAQSIWSGTGAQQVSEQYHVSDQQVRRLTTDEQEAYMDAMAATGWAGAAVSVLGAVVFGLSRRRLRGAGSRS